MRVLLIDTQTQELADSHIDSPAFRKTIYTLSQRLPADLDNPDLAGNFSFQQTPCDRILDGFVVWHLVDSARWVKQPIRSALQAGGRRFEEFVQRRKAKK